MSYNKKEMFFYLKPENYYRLDFVKKLKRSKNGYELLTLYEEMIIESLNKEGLLANMFGDEIVAYSIDDMVYTFQHSKKIIETGLKIFKDLNLIIEQNDGIYFIPMALEYTKRTTAGAEKKKEYRKKIKEKEDKCLNNNNGECLTDKYKEINIEKERKKEGEEELEEELEEAINMNNLDDEFSSIINEL